MSVIDEIPVLIDELRDDPKFVDELHLLRNRLALALAASHPNERKLRYLGFAQKLAEVISRLRAKR
jgi:hypothetical protein